MSHVPYIPCEFIPFRSHGADIKETLQAIQGQGGYSILNAKGSLKQVHVVQAAYNTLWEQICTAQNRVSDRSMGKTSEVGGSKDLDPISSSLPHEEGFERR
jgi:hypothetical protein